MLEKKKGAENANVNLKCGSRQILRMTNQPEIKKKKKITFHLRKVHNFGAGNGITTLGLRTASAGFTRRRIKKKITKNAKTLTPSMTLRLTSKIRIEL